MTATDSVEQPDLGAPVPGATMAADDDLTGAHVEGELRKIQCDATISKHVTASLGAAFIPLPAVDFAAITGVQIDMLYRLCKIYGVPFSKESARTVVASLLGGALPGLPSRILASGLKLVPVVGTVASMVISPTLAGVATYAVGRVFVQHLDSGGTLLTFDANKMKDHFERAWQTGKQAVAGPAKS